MRFPIGQNDRLPILTAQLLNGDGTPIDLASATVVLRMAAEDGTVKINNGSCTIVSAPTGQVSYTWGATDTDTVGDYRSEFIVTVGGLAFSVPNDGYDTISIQKKL